MLQFVAQLGRWLMLLPLLQVTLAHPVDSEYERSINSTYLTERAETFFLRVLPLGASITLGWGSSTGNGYAILLLKMLKYTDLNTDIVNLFVTNSGKMVGMLIWLAPRPDQQMHRSLALP